MPPEERRAHILDAAIVLIAEHGSAVTTRQIADAAGIAEGTVFRAFADKDALIDAAIARVMDPADTIGVLEEIDPTLPLDAKVGRIVEVLHRRVGEVVAFMAALGPREHARHHHSDKDGRRPPLGETTEAVVRLLAPDAHRLRVPLSTAVEYLRILVFGTSMPFLTTGDASDPEEIADFILRGIAKEGD